MRFLVVPCLLAVSVVAQSNPAPAPAAPAPAPAPAVAAPTEQELTIPAGTKVPVALKHAVSTKGTRTGDAVYAETTFPVVYNNRVLIPAGTYVQGRISEIQRGGRIKGRA